LETKIVFDESACAEFIYKRLIEKGVTVSIDDIRMVMDLEYEYGESIELYPPKKESGQREPIEVELLLRIVKVGGSMQLHSEVQPEETLAILQEAIESVKTFD
jgi:hypothetical protein